jgi:hypothetical protein
MKIFIKSFAPDGKIVDTVIESAGEIIIDLDPRIPFNCRVGSQDNKNGYLGPQCIIQSYMNMQASQILGFRIVPELGRDDSEYEIPVVNSDNSVL